MHYAELFMILGESHSLLGGVFCRVDSVLVPGP
jgi:hypothetical protein